METELICIDTSILIDFYRKKDKTKSFFYGLTKTYNLFAISVITEYEILIGDEPAKDNFWELFLDRVTILPFDRIANQAAVKIFRQLKADNKLIEIPDILIGATAVVNNLKMATLNKKHFERIKGLAIIGKS
ncbi:MAG TPA: type II toxin-antitoxin system VapC family toxin [Chitinophagaceae bacterium]